MPALAQPTPPWQRTLTHGTRTVEIYQIADRVTVLRDGRTVGTNATSELDEGS